MSEFPFLGGIRGLYVIYGDFEQLFISNHFYLKKEGNVIVTAITGNVKDNYVKSISILCYAWK